MGTFQKAVKKRVKVKVAVTGPSGSGKTMTSILIARGLVGPTGRIAVIDTENDSASLYSGEVSVAGRKTSLDFDTCPIEAPFTVEKYVGAIKDAIKEGYDALVIDSLSHVWAASGGLLEQKETLDARGKGNSYTNWATITKQHEAFKECVLQADIHIIGTMRSKQEYVLLDENGKKIPKKVGMAPIQRDGMEYEFTLVLDMAMNHSAEVSKDRTGIFDGKIFTPSEETGQAIASWLDGGAVVAKPAPYVTPSPLAAAKTSASSSPSAHKAAPTGDKFHETQERMKKLGTLPEEVILGFKERGWGQNKAAEWCETKGWDIAAIRHEMGLDVEQSGNTTEEIPFE